MERHRSGLSTETTITGQHWLERVSRALTTSLLAISVSFGWTLEPVT